MALRQRVHKAIQWFREATKEAIWVPQAIIIPMLFFGFGADRSYFILLRWVCCPAFLYLALQAFSQQKQNWVWVLGVAALFFNPLIPVRLERLYETWAIIDLAAMTIAARSIFVLKRK